MAKRQKFCIQANELTRRLMNIDEEEDETIDIEVEETIEQFTRQTKNSGWDVREAREMVVSGYAGWIRRKRRRLEEGSEIYRSAATSLPKRARTKLTGKEDWFRKKRKREHDEFDEKRKGKGKRRRQGEKEEEDEARTVSVMFVPYTKDGELAKRLREAESELGKQTGIKIKIVERTGTSQTPGKDKTVTGHSAYYARPR